MTISKKDAPDTVDVSLSGEWIRPLCGDTVVNECLITPSTQFRHPYAQCSSYPFIDDHSGDFYLEDLLNPDPVLYGYVKRIKAYNAYYGKKFEEMYMW